jgi:D-tyrosyl-tRNA(Tyr) deacylase
MRGLVQRVKSASVTVDGATVGSIGQGLCVLVGVTHTDTPEMAKKLAEKIWHLRVMDDDAGVMNRSVADTTRQVLIVSQFTLYGDTNAGRRPSWIAAARPEQAERRRIETHPRTGAVQLVEVRERVEEIAAGARLMPTFEKEFRSKAWSGRWTGRVVVLTAMRTYSAGFDLAAMLAKLGATVVGVPAKPTGGDA